MAKEVLAIPEYLLEDVIWVIRYGIQKAKGDPAIDGRALELLENWCEEEQEYIERCKS